MSARPPNEEAQDLRTLIRHGVDSLIVMPEQVCEVRLPNTRRRTVSGYFNDLDALVKCVLPWDGMANVYMTLNPVNPDLLARTKNRLEEYAKFTTTDKDITKRVWFPLDVDAVRPAGASATTGEMLAALVRMEEVIAFLRELGFQDPAAAGGSGNGGAARWRVDLENDEGTTRLVAGALTALSAKFSDRTVTIDPAVYNVARIWKVPGTIAAKGDNTEDRPHRRSWLNPPPAIHPLPLERDLLERLPAMAPAAPTPGRSTLWTGIGDAASST
jgi:hypothetical protein